MSGFLQEIESSLPDGLVLPGEFREMFGWMQSNGFVHECARGRYASLYPFAEDPEGCRLSLVTFRPVDAGTVSRWVQNDAHAARRLAPIVGTGGEGSYAAIWIDDEGRQRFVHLGSGSGSTMLCTLTDSATDFLRLLAIGYEELCWPEQFDLEPEQVIEDTLDEDQIYRFPSEFSAWVEATFRVAIPATAAEIVRITADMDADASDDPFWRWIRSLQTWP